MKNFDYSWFLNTYFGEDKAKGRRGYREYVYHAIEGEIENPFDEVVHQSIKDKNSLFESGSSKKSRLTGLCDGWG